MYLHMWKRIRIFLLIIHAIQFASHQLMCAFMVDRYIRSCRHTLQSSANNTWHLAKILVCQKSSTKGAIHMFIYECPQREFAVFLPIILR